MGESWGDSADGGVEVWCDDIVAALDELATLSNIRRIGIVGMRVGALLAVQSIVTGRTRQFDIKRLVLWDPVLCGDDFLRSASTIDRKFLNDPGRFHQIERAELPLPPRISGDTLVGYAYPPKVRESLRLVNLTTIHPWPKVPTDFLLSSANDSCNMLAAKLGEAGLKARCQVVARTEGAWDNYERHERALQAGGMVAAAVSALTAEDY
jgi:hypothetical protein